MIGVDLARRFIERVTKYTDYNVNIMDERGIIIASRDPERLGQYHALAHVLIFKTLPEWGERMMSEYRAFILEYLTDIQRYLVQEKRSAGFYIGSFQENYKQYFHSYHHCKWLERHFPEEEIVFFYEHLNTYLQQIAPMQELGAVFRIYEKRVPEKMRKNLTETILTLQQSNFNFGQAAEALYIHKNTLVYRFNQIRDLLGIDPVGSAEDRALADSLSCKRLFLLGRHKLWRYDTRAGL